MHFYGKEEEVIVNVNSENNITLVTFNWYAQLGGDTACKKKKNLIFIYYVS